MTEMHGKVSTHQSVSRKVKSSSAVSGEFNNEITDIHGNVSTYQNINGKVKTSSAINGGIDNDVKDRIMKDYNLLRNHPFIEGEELIGNKPLEAFGITRVLYGTKEEWNEKASLIGAEHTLYVYTNYDIDKDGNYIAGFKLGDGNSYLLDSPFLDANYYAHIRDNNIHVTPEEKQYWNEHIQYATTEYWSHHPIQTQEGYVYIYSDYKVFDDNVIAGVKIGDGNAYLADLPFLDTAYAQHITNSVIHVTQSEKDFWNDKVTCFIDPNKEDRLIFTKQSEEEYNNG